MADEIKAFAEHLKPYPFLTVALIHILHKNIFRPGSDADLFMSRT